MGAAAAGGEGEAAAGGVVGEAGQAADGEQAVAHVPGVGAGAVIGQVAVEVPGRVDGAGRCRQRGELVVGVVGGAGDATRGHAAEERAGGGRPSGGIVVGVGEPGEFRGTVIGVARRDTARQHQQGAAVGGVIAEADRRGAARTDRGEAIARGERVGHFRVVAGGHRRRPARVVVGVAHRAERCARFERGRRLRGQPVQPVAKKT